MEEGIINTPATPAPAPDLSALLIGLLKGVLYRESDERQWAALLNLQARVRDYLAVLNLALVLDEAEGYAVVKSRPDPAEDDDATPRLPRLVARRPLSYPVSLLLALLRKKLAEFDAGGGGARGGRGRGGGGGRGRGGGPEGPNEAKLIDQIETTINKVAELGFLHKLKLASIGTTGPASYE